MIRSRQSTGRWPPSISISRLRTPSRQVRGESPGTAGPELRGPTTSPPQDLSTATELVFYFYFYFFFPFFAITGYHTTIVTARETLDSCLPLNPLPNPTPKTANAFIYTWLYIHPTTLLMALFMMPSILKSTKGWRWMLCLPCKYCLHTLISHLLT